MVFCVLGPSARAAYLHVARHWGSLRVYSDAHNHAGVAAKGPVGASIFLHMRHREIDVAQKSRVLPIQWMPSDNARPFCSTRQADECHSLQRESALKQPVSSGCVSAFLERKPSDHRLVVIRS